VLELSSPLEEMVQRGTRDILRQAIEAEVPTRLDEYAPVQLMDGRQAVVRNGHRPSREILTGIGPVEIQVPKIRDRSGAGIQFTSALAPPYGNYSATPMGALGGCAGRSGRAS